MELGLSGRSVAITGGTAGIGKAIALAFLKENCDVAICSRNEYNVAEAVNEFAGMGYKVYGNAADVTNYESIKSFANDVEKVLGKIDIWVNNAGNNYYKLLLDFEIDEWRRVIDLNLNSVFFATKAVAPIMRKNTNGVIINIASYAGVIPQVGKGCYAAAKSGLIQLTRAFAGELAPLGIRVVALTPGPVYSKMTSESYRINPDKAKASTAQQRIGAPEEIASWAVFVSSDAAAYFTGNHIEISGGKFCVQDPRSAWDAYAEEKQ